MTAIRTALALALAALLASGCAGRVPDIASATAALPASLGGAAPAGTETAEAAADGEGTAASGEETAVAAAPTALAPADGPSLPFLSPDLGPAERRAHAAIVVDANSGRVLHAEDADGLRYPASLTKMMTLYLLFDAIEAGRFNLATPLVASEEAASRPPAKLGLKPGETITVDQAIRAMAVRSSNDVAVVVAEAVAGSEEAFARQMTGKARALGMRRTRFVNASGLPDERQVSTARDMATLGRALMRDHRRFAGYFTLKEWTYEGRRIRATNKLLGEVPGVRGIKTGYIRDSGFNLAVSVRRGGRHVIAVVFGGRTGRARNETMKALIERWVPEAGAPTPLAGIGAGGR